MAYVSDAPWVPLPHPAQSPGANLGAIVPDTVIETGTYGGGAGVPWTDADSLGFTTDGGHIYDTGDLSGDLFPGPQNVPGVPDRHVDYSAAGTPFGVPVGTPYVSPIQFVDRPVVHVSLWQHKMDDNAAPNGLAKGTWDGDSPLQGLYVPPPGQYVRPDVAQPLTLQSDAYAYNANAGYEIPPALSPAWNE